MKTRKFCQLFFALLFICPCLLSSAKNGVIKGIAFDEKSFEILNNTRVKLYSGYEFIGIVISNDEGVFTLRAIDTGWYTIVIASEYYQTRRLDSIRIDSNTLYLLYPKLKNIKGYYINDYSRGEVVSKRFTQPDYVELYYPFYGLKIYPNPVQDFLYIERSGSNSLEVKIFDMNGNVFEAFKINEKHLAISLQHLPKGMYTIQFLAINDQKDFRFLKLE